ncbi:hypothetical protein MIT9_P0762 [Methylomarinovum caldicuralii]|uniref:DUF1614 domain-containing protein n=1 Tax=Methylomarinovum caldicuralii TaxID=438856 RepID=A0AAU9C9M4_9GAMM|nr:DUF1614 domain-containing protein [Methylomarinovum caldicuralii]BCX81184.1 hypothetical protein MIT9_P0762 [Methylomarinovum caldicuralii]
MRSPFSLLHFLLFFFLLVFLLTFIQLQLITLSFERLGLSPTATLLMLLGSLLGSGINIPLFSIRAEPPPEVIETPFGLLRPPPLPFTGRTVIAVNVGGCLIPLLFSLYLITRLDLPLPPLLLGTAIVALLSYVFSRPVPGMGIGMPMLLPPLIAATVAVVLGGEEYRAPFAYICGTLGVLIGADVLHLRDIPRLGAPMASIGGAGTFDGIFMTGVLAVLLA